MSHKKRAGAQLPLNDYPITLKDSTLLIYFGLSALVGVLLLHAYYDYNCDSNPLLRGDDDLPEHIAAYQDKDLAYNFLTELYKINHHGVLESIKANKTFGTIIFIVILFIVYAFIFREIIKRRILRKERKVADS
jgi:hypothetical protein